MHGRFYRPIMHNLPILKAVSYDFSDCTREENSCPFLHIESLYKDVQDFLDIQYAHRIVKWLKGINILLSDSQFYQIKYIKLLRHLIARDLVPTNWSDLQNEVENSLIIPEIYVLSFFNIHIFIGKLVNICNFMVNGLFYADVFISHNVCIFKIY